MPVSRALLCVPVVLSVIVGSACATEGPSSPSRDRDDPAPLAQRWESPKQSAAPFGCAGTKIALATRSGYYVGAFGGGGFGMIATARRVGRPETFTSIDLGSGRVALQAASGHYVSAENGGGGSVYANQAALGPTTTFILQPHWDEESITLRTPSNYFLNALLGGGTVMNTNTRAAGDWEALQPLCLDGKLDADEPRESYPSEPDEPAYPSDSDEPELGLGG